MMDENCKYFRCINRYCKAYKLCLTEGARCKASCSVCQINKTCLYSSSVETGRKENNICQN